MSSHRRKSKPGKLKVRLPLPEKGEQTHVDRRHQARKYKARRTHGKQVWRVLEE